jgi:hypothetical protein
VRSRIKFVIVVTFLAVAVVVVGVLSVILVNRSLFSPEGVVRSYFAALEIGDASSARALPGVVSPELDLDQLVLLQAAAYIPPSQVAVSVARVVADKATVEASFVVGGTKERATFTLVAEPPLLGIFEQWRFAAPPLGQLQVTVAHDTGFQVGELGEVDIRSYPGGRAEAFLASATFPVFVGAGYDLYRTSALLTAAHQTLTIADTGHHEVTLDVSATPRFVAETQTAVDEALAKCVAQTVLMPSGCPFGYATENRWVGDATWTIATSPRLTIVPGEESWLATGNGVAHVSGTVQSLFDGSSSPVEADQEFTLAVPLWVTGPATFAF